MPDIKTALQEALSKAANAWAADDEAHQQIDSHPVKPQEKTMTITAPAPAFVKPLGNILSNPMLTPDKRITNNVTRAVFNFVRDNPGVPRAEARKRLVALGFSGTTVSSLTSQMIYSKLIRITDNDELFAAKQEYAPLKRKPSKAKRQAARAKAKEVPKVEKSVAETQADAWAGIAALQPATTAAPTPVHKAKAMVALHRVEDPADIVAKMNVVQARELYDYLRKIFGG